MCVYECVELCAPHTLIRMNVCTQRSPSLWVREVLKVTKKSTGPPERQGGAQTTKRHFGFFAKKKEKKKKESGTQQHLLLFKVTIDRAGFIYKEMME